MRDLFTQGMRSLPALRNFFVAALFATLFLSLSAAPQAAAEENAQAAASENAQAAAEGSARAAADDGTQTVTFYHFELMHYDDPTFEDMGVPELAGMRLLGTSTMEGLRPGDVVDSWEHVGTHPGFVFFDGWPHNFTVSDDPSKNVVQLNYFRAHNDMTVNFYEASLEGAASQLPLRGTAARGAAAAEGALDDASDVVTETIGGQNVSFKRLGSTVRKGELFADVLAGDDIAKQAAEGSNLDADSPYGELAYVGSYPENVFVSMDAGKNEINLVYTRPAAGPDDAEVESDAATLPDDVYVEDDTVTLPDDMEVESDAVTLPDHVYVEDEAVPAPDDGAGSDGPADSDAPGQDGSNGSASGGANGAPGDGSNGGSNAGSDGSGSDSASDGPSTSNEESTQVVEKPSTSANNGAESKTESDSAVRPLPQTGDTNGLVLAVALVASALAAVGAAVALRKIRR